MAGDSSAYRKLFPEKHIPLIFSFIYQAGETLRKKTETDREDWITRRLCNRVIRIPAFRDSPLDIRPKTELLSPDIDADYSEGEVDILISCGLEHQVYFVIEAKRLRYKSPGGRFETGNRAYLYDGMMRFITGQYAPFMETSAMLGYVFDGKTDEARSGLNIYIKRKEKILKLNPPKRLKQSDILPKKPIDETAHNLGSRSFTLYHIFLPV